MTSTIHLRKNLFQMVIQSHFPCFYRDPKLDCRYTPRSLHKFRNKEVSRPQDFKPDSASASLPPSQPNFSTRHFPNKVYTLPKSISTYHNPELRSTMSNQTRTHARDINMSSLTIPRIAQSYSRPAPRSPDLGGARHLDSAPYTP